MAENENRFKSITGLGPRVITGAVLAVVAVVLVLATPLWLLSLVASLAAAVAIWELRAMLGMGSLQIPRDVCLFLPALTPFWAIWGGGAALAWLGLSIVAFTLVPMALGEDLGQVRETAGRGAWAGLYAGGLFAALIVLATMPQGRYHVLFVLFTVVVADVGAYFVGHLYGKRKLAPVLSPGKTWEGLFGGLLIPFLGGALFNAFFLPDIGPVAGAWLAVLMALVSIGGDLLESGLKRAAQVKDSGYIFPGHGGLLDRVDGILAAGAVYLFVRLVFWSGAPLS